MTAWAAVRCQARHEVIVGARLEQSIGAAVYVPKASVLSPRTLEPITISVYAGYFFSDLDQGPPWQAIRRQPGVIDLVMTGDAPSRCPEAEILKLKASEIDGLVQLAGQPSVNGHRFAIGERVKIQFGAFDGRTGVYQGEAYRQRKAYVLVCLLGRQVRVKIRADALAAA